MSKNKQEENVIIVKYKPTWAIRKSVKSEQNIVVNDSLTEYRDKGEIYCITNRITNQKYIGQTRCIKHRQGKEYYSGYLDRFQQHLSNAFDEKHMNDCAKFYQAIRQYGKENFFVTLLEVCAITQINFRERYYIKILKSKRYGYNLTRGGQAKPWKAKMYARRRKKNQTK